MKIKLKNLIFKNLTQIRYIISGIFFTIIGPSFFIFLASYISPKIAITISEVLINLIRYNVITRWVFRSRINRKSIYAYLKATIPLFIRNFTLVSLLVPLFGTVFVALIVATFSATIGFIWNKICYRKTNKIS